MVERVIRALEKLCAHRCRFETPQHAARVISDWIQFYNHRRPHQALDIKIPAEAYALAATLVQKLLGHCTPTLIDSKHGVARLLRREGIRSQTGYRRRSGGRGDKPAVVAPNHLNR